MTQYLSKPPPPNGIPLGVRISTNGFQGYGGDTRSVHASEIHLKFTFILQLIIGHYTSSCLHQDTLLIFSICSYSVSPKETRIVSPDILKCILGCQARTGQCEHVVHTLQSSSRFLFFLFCSFGQDTFSMRDLSSAARPGIKPPEVEVWNVNHQTSREVPPNPSLCGTVDLVQY